MKIIIITSWSEKMTKRTHIIYITMSAQFVLLICIFVTNGFFECTDTKAYGFPFPWRIDYCQCKGGQTVYPYKSFFLGSTILLFVLTFVLSCIYKFLQKIIAKKKGSVDREESLNWGLFLAYWQQSQFRLYSPFFSRDPPGKKSLRTKFEKPPRCHHQWFGKFSSLDTSKTLTSWNC